ncbi:MAG: hypothetical protein M8349_00530, partial [ANME-2 cluster archaeon]|nr:hypothetical protein [ANME-2 cluster archaeon]
TMDYYLDPQYFPVWSSYMMPSEGPPPASFMYMSLASGLITNLIFAGFYSFIKGSVPGATMIKKGLLYGLLIFIITGVPFTLTLILLINLPFGLILSWAAESLVIYLIGGLLVAKIIS